MISSGAQIDSTARVAAGARIGQDVAIGPYCVIGPDVVIGDGCKLESHVCVSGNTTIGAGTIVSPFAVLGGAPQSVHYRGGQTRLVIGANCIIRESVTISRGSEDGGGLTEVGDHGFFMAYSHIAHDCRVGRHVIFANSATLAGHCVVGDHVFIGGLTAVQQFGWIGSHAMVGGLTGVRTDVIPFAIASGDGPRLTGVNTIGMQRRNFSKEAIRTLRAAYRLLFFGKGLLQERIAAVEAAHAGDPAVATLLEFVRAPRKRPLAQPRLGAPED